MDVSLAAGESVLVLSSRGWSRPGEGGRLGKNTGPCGRHALREGRFALSDPGLVGSSTSSPTLSDLINPKGPKPETLNVP